MRFSSLSREKKQKVNDSDKGKRMDENQCEGAVRKLDDIHTR